MSSKTTSNKVAKVSKKNRIIDNIDSPILRQIEVLSIAESADIARRDAEYVSSNTSVYVKGNTLTYYIAINLWILSISDVTARGGLELLEAIVRLGLLTVIRICDEAANNLIATKYHYVARVPEANGFLVTLMSAATSDQQALQWLRLLKRFTPYGADLLGARSIAGLQLANKRCKLMSRSGYSTYWVERIRSVVHDITGGFVVDYNRGFFSSGVAADAGRPLMDKLFAYAKWSPRLYDETIHSNVALYAVGDGVTERRPTIWLTRNEAHAGTFFTERYVAVDPGYIAQVLTVPKSYKTHRTIAMESAYRQFHMQAIRLALEECIERNGYSSYLDLHSQEANQAGAREGSIDGGYATIDLSSASDSVSRSLVRSLFPADICHELDKYLPTHYVVDGHVVRMDMFCTSGSAVTFPVESITFLATAIAVTSVVASFTGDSYKHPIVFGDDILVDARVFDTLAEVLDILGFTVNDSKSFGSFSRYRESCGVEYADGLSLQSKYWPRAVISWKELDLPLTVAQLCSLQHRLYHAYFAQKFLTSVVRYFYPNMTSHGVGTECVDLWEDIPVFTITHAPGLENCDHPGAQREVHMTLKTRRQNRTKTNACGTTGQHVVEMWRYATFLRLGPTYDDELLRLLGVSTKPQSIASDCDTGEQYWGTTRE